MQSVSKHRGLDVSDGDNADPSERGSRNCDGPGAGSKGIEALRDVGAKVNDDQAVQPHLGKTDRVGLHPARDVTSDQAARYHPRRNVATLRMAAITERYH